LEENIKTALTEFINITETEWLVFSESLIIKHYKKGEYFLREEDLCDYIGYTDKGLFSYYYLINGVEHIRGFFFPNDFISNYPCYLLNNKSKAYIKALEDSSLTLIHRDVISLLYKKLPKIQEFSRNIVENLYIEVSEKYESFFLKTAEERYLELIIRRPLVFKRVPQYMIASYLGITPEGLSRIRKRIYH
jgi:CRP-like cAMP-binding protein